MKLRTVSNRLTAVVCSLVLLPGSLPSARSERVSQQASAPAEEAPKIPNEQLDSLVAPIALYPDPLLAQVLAASTYPLEIIQLQQWLTKNKDLKDKALADAVAKQPWDSSVQAMAARPDLVKRLADDIQWVTDLGNAFLAQQSDVMDAVQRMRVKAKDTGNLKSSEQVKVETKVIESKSVVVIEQSNPEVVYVPSYNPTVVYGPPAYPYPPIYYPPPGYYAAGMAISFGIGVAMGAAWGGGWGNCGWGGNNNVTINNNNNFNRNTNVNGGNRNNVNSGNRGGNGNWSHNPQHRGGAPYSNKSTANKFGGTARGDSMGNRQADARQRQQSGASNRASGGAGDRGSSNRAGASGGGGNRPSAGGMDSNRGGGGGDRVGNGSVSKGSNAGSKGGAFGGSSGGGSSARASSSRGSSSMSSSRGGGGGGGSRGGGGGGRRR